MPSTTKLDPWFDAFVQPEERLDELTISRVNGGYMVMIPSEDVPEFGITIYVARDIDEAFEWARLAMTTCKFPSPGNHDYGV